MSLYRLSQRGDVDGIHSLVKKGVDVNTKNEPYEYTALHYGCRNGHANVIPPLVKAGIDVNAKDTKGRTALHLGCQCGHTNVIPHLVDAGCDISGNEAHGDEIRNALADNKQRRLAAGTALDEVGFTEFANSDEVLDFLFLPAI